MKRVPLTLNVNDEIHELEVEPHWTLLEVLREQLDLTGAKEGCGEGVCGSCTVLLNGVAVRSCQVGVAKVAGKEVTTIEGLSENGDHPLQRAWLAEQTPQCGYCQTGIMLQAADFLSRKPNPSEEQIDEVMDDVICRCGSHPRIKKAIRLAAEMIAKQGGKS